MENQQAEIDSYTQDTEGRKENAAKAFWLTVGWLVCVVVMLFSTGYDWIDLSDRVLVTLLVVTVLKVLGVLLLVMQYYFRSIRRTH